MTFLEKTVEGLPVFVLEGKIMGATPECLALCQRMKKLGTSGRRYLVLDFTNVNWINSAGIGLMISCVTGLRRVGGDVYFVGIHDRVTHCFKITRLDTVLQVRESTEAVVSEVLHMAISG